MRYIPALFFVGLAIVFGEGAILSFKICGAEAVGNALGAFAFWNLIGGILAAAFMGPEVK